MYNSPEIQKTPNLRISGVQILMIISIVLGVFVVPAYLIERSRTPDYTDVYTSDALYQRLGGNVAGANTDSVFTIPIIGLSLDLNSETGILILSGLVLILVAVVLIVYLVATKPKK